MPNPDEQEIAPFPKPIEMNLADVVFIAMRKNLMLFKDLSTKHVHYSFFINGCFIDCHQTLETEKKHIPLLKLEFDWQFLLRKISEEIIANWRSIFQTIKVDDPEWKDLEVEFIPMQTLMELLPPLIKGARWNVNLEFLNRLEQSLGSAKLKELAKHGASIGIGSGYLVLCHGSECFIFDIQTMTEIFEKSFELSIRKIYLKHYTPRLILWLVKIRLLNLVHSTIRRLKMLNSHKIDTTAQRQDAPTPASANN
jgi:hypothetical protein